MAVLGFRRGILLLALVAMTAAGCSATHVQLPADYYDSPRKEKVAIVLGQTPPAVETRPGNEGILVQALAASAAKTFRDCLAKYQTHSAFTHLASAAFGEELSKRFSETRILDETIEVMGLSETQDGDDEVLSRLDVRRLASGNRVDAILFLRVLVFDVLKGVRGFDMINTHGHMKVQGILVEGATNKVLWNCTTESIIGVEGEWDHPPKYPRVARAMAVAAATSVGDLFEDLARMPPPRDDPEQTVALLHEGM